MRATIAAAATAVEGWPCAAGSSAGDEGDWQLSFPDEALRTGPLTLSPARLSSPPAPPHPPAVWLPARLTRAPPPPLFPARSHVRLYSAEGRLLCGGTYRGPLLSPCSLAGGVSVRTRAVDGGHLAPRLTGRRGRWRSLVSPPSASAPAGVWSGWWLFGLARCPVLSPMLPSVPSPTRCAHWLADGAVSRALRRRVPVVLQGALFEARLCPRWGHQAVHRASGKGTDGRRVRPCDACTCPRAARLRGGVLRGVVANSTPFVLFFLYRLRLAIISPSICS